MPHAKDIDRAWPGLDFANTVSFHTSDEPIEQLTDTAAVVAWAVENGVLDAAEAAATSAHESSVAQANQFVEDAIGLREAVFRALSAVAHSESVEQDDLGLLTRYARAGTANATVVRSGDGFKFETSVADGNPELILWRVALDVVELLVHGPTDRIGRCEYDFPGCGWLFIDTSKNKSRRWCDMNDCGNKAKARRFNERSRKAPSTA